MWYDKYMQEKRNPFMKKIFGQRIQEDKDDHSLFDQIYAAGLILAFLSVISAIVFLLIEY
jgi:hypothetical protein